LDDDAADFFADEASWAMPSLSKAESWKHSDLPPPVGRMVEAGEHFSGNAGG